MIEVRVLIDCFKDNDIYQKETTIRRGGKELKIHQKLLMKDDEYSISKERAKYLSKKGIVEIIEKSKSSKSDNAEDTNE